MSFRETENPELMMDERDHGMDFIPPDPDLPFQQSIDELFFQVSSTPSRQHTDPQQDTLLMSPPPVDFSDLPLELDIPGERRHKTSATPNSYDGTTCNERKKKMILHRDVERQRRQEMATLYASLRSLLPPQYLKGKRSISDHMNGAANYVRNLQKRVQELSDKRDGLRNMPNLGPSDIVTRPEVDVTVQLCSGAMEVVISSGLRNGEFPLSRVLKVLVEQGFRVVNCVSTTVNERSLHTIQSEVNDLTSMDPSGLQQELIDLIASCCQKSTSTSSGTLDDFIYQLGNSPNR